MLKEISAWLKKKIQERLDAVQFEKKIIVCLDNESISAIYQSGEIESIRWEDVNCIAIETNDSGPWGADLWWLFEGKEKRCAYPGGATGYLDALRELPTRFPGFSDEMVIKANGCTSNARFVCWQRNSGL